MRQTVNGGLLVALFMLGCSRPNISGLARKDEVCISPGEFVMGHEALPMLVKEAAFYNPAPTNDWAPTHIVALSDFCIDRFEVTWSRYLKCVDAGICSHGAIDAFPATKAALTTDGMGDRPAFNVRFHEAEAFCLWEGKRLPTEAEWERAARGSSQRDFPWGNSRPTEELLNARVNYGPSIGDEGPAPVGSLAEDTTEEGVRDMFSSVGEWVGDWYSPDSYVSSEKLVDPTGPASPVFLSRAHPFGMGNVITARGEKVVRGLRYSLVGARSWPTASAGAPMWFRDRFPPDSPGMGFRCARSARAQPTQVEQ